jgi:hypothetical protein
VLVVVAEDPSDACWLFVVFADVAPFDALPFFTEDAPFPADPELEIFIS